MKAFSTLGKPQDNAELPGFDDNTSPQGEDIKPTRKKKTPCSITVSHQFEIKTGSKKGHGLRQGSSKSQKPPKTQVILSQKTKIVPQRILVKISNE